LNSHNKGGGHHRKTGEFGKNMHLTFKAEMFAHTFHMAVLALKANCTGFTGQFLNIMALSSSLVRKLSWQSSESFHISISSLGNLSSTFYTFMMNEQMTIYTE
jgi:hypothetical protein